MKYRESLPEASGNRRGDGSLFVGKLNNVQKSIGSSGFFVNLFRSKILTREIPLFILI